MMARSQIVKELNTYLAEYYSSITQQRGRLSIVYKPNISHRDSGDVSDKFITALKRVAAKEWRQGKTLVGPHRDEFIFGIGGNELRKFASRGEHKSALVSLKAAEAQVLFKRTGIYPILLLDDLFAELDKNRSTNVIDLFDDHCQLFTTGTSLDYAGLGQKSNTLKHYTFMVQRGDITSS